MEAATVPMPSEPGQSLARARVLVVDDDPDTLCGLVTLLHARVGELRTATTGQEALDMALGDPPDVVLLDLRLPDLSGLEVCARLAAHPATRGVPVLLLTGYGTEQLPDAAFAAGGIDYLHKPVVHRELLARLGLHLDRRDAQRRLEEREAVLRRLLATAQEGIWVVDPSGRTLLANARMAELVCETSTMLAAQGLFAYLDQGAWSIWFERLRPDAAPYTGHTPVLLHRADGSALWARISVAPQPDTGSGPSALLMVADMTAEVQAAQASAEALQVQRVLTDLATHLLALPQGAGPEQSLAALLAVTRPRLASPEGPAGRVAGALEALRTLLGHDALVVRIDPIVIGRPVLFWARAERLDGRVREGLRACLASPETVSSDAGGPAIEGHPFGHMPTLGVVWSVRTIGPISTPRRLALTQLGDAMAALCLRWRAEREGAHLWARLTELDEPSGGEGRARTAQAEVARCQAAMLAGAGAEEVLARFAQAARRITGARQAIVGDGVAPGILATGWLADSPRGTRPIRSQRDGRPQRVGATHAWLPFVTGSDPEVAGAGLWLRDPEHLDRTATLTLQRAGEELLRALRQRAAEAQYRATLAAQRDTLTQLNGQLAAALNARRAFLGVISHELRTPLAAVLGLAEALLFNALGPLPPPVHEALETIHGSADHLRRLIDDLIELSRAEREDETRRTDPLDLSVALTRWGRLMQPIALRAQVQLELDGGPEALWVQTDDLRLRQVVINLVENAIKFTPAGGCVRIALAPGTGTAAVHLRVQDQGPGIPEHALARCFEPFVQLDADYTRKTGGSGLGLALVARLARHLGAGLTAEPRSGGGMEFALSLPAAPPEVLPTPIGEVTGPRISLGWLGADASNLQRWRARLPEVAWMPVVLDQGDAIHLQLGAALVVEVTSLTTAVTARLAHLRARHPQLPVVVVRTVRLSTDENLARPCAVRLMAEPLDLPALRSVLAPALQPDLQVSHEYRSHH